jgi:hypothetical protein
MVARMTLAQIAQYLEVDEHLAHAVLNRIGVVSPASSEDTTLMMMRDLERAQEEMKRRQQWASGEYVRTM